MKLKYEISIGDVGFDCEVTGDFFGYPPRARGDEWGSSLEVSWDADAQAKFKALEVLAGSATTREIRLDLEGQAQVKALDAYRNRREIAKAEALGMTWQG